MTAIGVVILATQMGAIAGCYFLWDVTERWRKPIGPFDYLLFAVVWLFLSYYLLEGFLIAIAPGFAPGGVPTSDY